MTCEHAGRDKKGRITCSATESLCAHVYYCGMRGKWELNDIAKRCPLRKKEDSNHE
jgi:hypothetical protein